MYTDKTEQKVLEYMRRYGMVSPGERILAAVSGGADSVCLLVILNELKDRLGIKLGAFHLNHGIRGAEADKDERYVKNLCEELGIPCFIMHEDVPVYAAENGLSEEEAGRNLRYRDLSGTAEREGYDRIATAHKTDDDAETVLFNLFRGSGLGGIAGIPPVRDKVIRPLLGLSGSEIKEYLTARGIEWCEDSTNSENSYARNRIRNTLIPWVEENVNSDAVEHILKTASFAAEADGYFKETAKKIVDENVKDHAIPTDIFDGESEIVKGYIIREMILQTGAPLKDITERHIASIIELTGPGGGTHVDLPYGLTASRGYDTLRIGSGKKDASAYSLTSSIRVFPFKKDARIPKSMYTKWFDYDKIGRTPVFRTRKEGDYIELAGTGRKSLNRFFIDCKVPREERDLIPLFADGDHIIWVVGYRISEYYKITEDTKNVMEVTVSPNF